MPNFTLSVSPQTALPLGAFAVGAVCGSLAVGALNSKETKENLQKVWESCTLANIFVGCGYFWLSCQARRFLWENAKELLNDNNA